MWAGVVGGGQARLLNEVLGSLEPFDPFSERLDRRRGLAEIASAGQVIQVLGGNVVLAAPRQTTVAGVGSLRPVAADCSVCYHCFLGRLLWPPPHV